MKDDDNAENSRSQDTVHQFVIDITNNSQVCRRTSSFKIPFVLVSRVNIEVIGNTWTICECFFAAAAAAVFVLFLVVSFEQ